MNIKRIIAGVLAVCVIGTALPSAYGKTADNAVITASAADEYTEGTEGVLKYHKYADYIEITRCDKEAVGEIIIPETIEGLPVTSIGFDAFSFRPGLTSITIPDSVTKISGNAFSFCSGLTSINIPDRVTNIGDYAFWSCTELTEITIPDGVTEIGQRTFSDCEKLTEITIPNGVTWISINAFSGCRGLTKITIPDSVKGIGWGAFSYTSWLENKQKENPLVIVNGILIDGTTCSGDVVIPNSVISICGSAFSRCNELTSITIPDSVTSIGWEAFYQCTGLTEITIPESVTSIDSEAFCGCESLTEITVYNPICSISDLDNTISDTATIYGYENSTAKEYAEKYERKFVSLGKNSAMPDESLKFKHYGDYIEITGCDKSAVSVEIPAEIYGVPITSIGYSAFEGCSGLTSIEIPNSVKSIGDSAFVACSNLNSITILNPDCDICDDEWTFAGNAYLRDDGYHLLGINGVFHVYSGTIYGYDNSTAQEYAEKYNITFVSLGKAPEKSPEMGDIDGDGKVDSSDASLVLSEYSLLSTGKNGNFSEDEKKRAELNNDEKIDSSDASLILAYYSHTSTGGTDSIEDFLAKK